MAADISAKIGIDGDRAFKDSIRAIDGELKALNAEMKAAVAEFDLMDEAEQDSAKKSQILTGAIDKQKQKLSVLEGQYGRQVTELDKLANELDRAKKEFGENSEEATKAQNAYNKQSGEVNKLRTQIANANKDIAVASKELRDMGNASGEAGKGLENAGHHASVFGDTLKGVLSANLITAGVSALTNGIKNVVSGFKDGINAAAAYGDSIDKQSQKMQITAEEYQKLAFAAERSGTSIEVMANAQKTLAGTNFNGSLIDAIQSVASIADESERAARATELFGKKAGMEMLPLLNSGAEGIQALYDEYVSLGGVMSNEAVAAAASYEDAMTNLQTALNGVKNQMLGEFLPGITQVFSGMVEIIKGNTEEGKAMVEEGFSNIQQKMEEFTQNIAEHAPEMLEMGIKLISALILGIVKSLPTLLAQAPELVGVLVDGIISLLSELEKTGSQMMDTIIDALKDKFSEIKDVGKDLAKGLWEGIKSMSTWLKQQIEDWCTSILDSVKEFFDINSPSRVMRDEVGKMLGKGMAAGIDASASDAIASMEDMGKAIMGATPDIESQFDMQANLNEGLVNGMMATQNSAPVNLSVRLVLSNGQLIAEQIFDDLLNVSRQRGVSLATN